MKKNYDKSVLMPYRWHVYFDEHAKSWGIRIDCPVCGKKGIKVIRGTVAGSGKLCPVCKSKFMPMGVLRNMDYKNDVKAIPSR